MTIIYALSGLALNHLRDWNPNYIVTHERIHWHPEGEVTADAVQQLLQQHDLADQYKTHYFPNPDRLKIFLKSGSVDIDLNTGNGYIEHLRKRPLFFQVNFLHYNPRTLWTWFSDLFCVALLLIAVTGLFIIRGKNGITGRGAILTGIGIIIPAVFLLIYL